MKQSVYPINFAKTHFSQVVAAPLFVSVNVVATQAI
jgi:hypothetical protein